jgi:hypothetical protein
VELGILDRTSPLSKLLWSVSNGRADHIRIQFDQDCSSFQYDSECGAVGRRGNDHTGESGKRPEVDCNYGPFDHGLFAAPSLRHLAEAEHSPMVLSKSSLSNKKYCDSLSEAKHESYVRINYGPNIVLSSLW